MGDQRGNLQIIAAFLILSMGTGFALNDVPGSPKLIYMQSQSFRATMNLPFSASQADTMGLISLHILVSDDLTQMEQSLAQTYKDNMTLVTRSLEQYKNEMAIFQKKYDMLRDDYQYNLEVIKERDEELKKYDTYVANLREVAAFSRGSRRRE